jgi:hypothetical protein
MTCGLCRRVLQGKSGETKEATICNCGLFLKDYEGFSWYAV